MAWYKMFGFIKTVFILVIGFIELSVGNPLRCVSKNDQ